MDTRRKVIMKTGLNLIIMAVALLVTVSISYAAGRVEYYHTDALGSVIASTDEDGNVLWRESYKPFGSRIQKEVSTDDNTPFYTGKPHDDTTGLSYFGARYYDPYVGRFTGIDPAGVDPANLHSFNRYAYANNNPYKYVDPDGRAGQLAIESSGDGGSSMTSGHSWLTYKKDGSSDTTTYGTWGNNPRNLGNGLHTNLEAGRTGDASRGTHIDDAQEKILMKTISEYKKKGADAWQYSAPCSAFSSDTWGKVTGEKLDANWGPINNPTTLKESIIRANGGEAHSNGVTSKDRKSTDSSTGVGSSSASSGSSLNSSGDLLR